MKFPGGNLSKFGNDALGVVLSASERAGPEVTHLVSASQQYPLPPSRSLALNARALIGSFDRGPRDSMEM